MISYQKNRIFRVSVCIFMAGLFLMSVLANTVNAETLIIPTGTECIEEEAFRSCASIESVCVQEGVTQIGNRAFYECTALKEAQFPASLEEIGEDAFSDCGECLLIDCPPGSAAAAWAAVSHLDWDADTVCRGLSIGQTYTNTSYALIGPTYDMHAMAFCLRRMNRRNYTVTERSNLTVQEIRSAIAAAFSDAGENDISLLYYSGHGENDGSLLGSDMSILTPSELRTCLDAVPGRKVVIVDACYSGSLIQDQDSLTASVSSDSFMTVESVDQSIDTGDDQNSDPASFTESFLGAFSDGDGSEKRLRSRGALQSEQYFVMASCQAAEESQEGYITSGGSGRYMGYFTYALCEGCGWNGVTNRECELLADGNADGVVTFAEAFGYASDWAVSRNENQHAAVYPEGCTWFSPFRK